MSLKKINVRRCDKRATNKVSALRQNSDSVVREISQLLGEMSVSPSTVPKSKKMKPLGVACGKARPYRGGMRRKMFINVNRKKDTRFYCSSLSYLQSKLDEHHKSNKKTSRLMKRNSSLTSQGIGHPASTSNRGHYVTESNEPSSRASTFLPKSEQSAAQTQGLNFQGSEQSPFRKDQSNESILFGMARETASRTDISQPMSTREIDCKPKELPCSSASGTRQRSRRGQSSRRTNLEFSNYLDKRVITKMPGSRWVEGTLRGYDTYMNLVLEDTVELRRTGQRVHIGVAVIRGRSIAMVEEAGNGLSPDIIRRSYYYHEKKPLKTIQLDD
ncbi:uncharacterized protein [Palaemon carinicauda]|uniref:uncharacterized protein n=1 Tax=Palaemon carinicauda TaxID=392227 RepID=UPI0035B5845F